MSSSDLQNERRAGRKVKIHPKLLQKYNRSSESIMVRGLDGNIAFWNLSAEAQYGLPRSLVVGKVSHEVLETVFPCPLEQINAELLRKGHWEGELIHSIGGGLRVKVKSRWELDNALPEPSPAVVEINRVEEIVGPENAHLSGAPLGSSRLRFWPALFWPFVLTLLIIGLLVMAGHSRHPVPFHDIHGQEGH